ncbi:LacI family transcriptional regulator [Hydrogenispora ethanolica]|uniref:LacI family transcriptional regulator n=1 Tax=Hydrogenispora ethanolica TaxID=1082276 RepID=A0A4R1R8A0_HYDET|nr:LacI family DNA-binding transcriptional regulator [Hydrogenispora ethanolica]TCL61873.1 LacI family transcriptional regulator [Hydrogenispora ethanolica]
MRSTLKEIAAKANVSISTVSRIINDDQSKPASPETKERVWKIVRELGYVPNLNARTLKNQSPEEQPLRTKAIGCIFTSTRDTFTDPFFSIIARGIQLEAAQRGYVLGYSFSSCDMTQSALYNNITSNRVDGAVVLGRFDREFLEFLKNNFPNLVYAGLNCVNSGFDEVICDAYRASIQAVKYLIGLGHAKIGYLGPVPEAESGNGVINEHRYEGFCRAMAENDLPVHSEWIQGVELTSDASYQRMKQLLHQEQLPTAFFCANDTVAIGAMRAAREAGLRIPEDLSLVGIDDIEMAAYVTPALTTIRVPKEELGKFAAKILIDRIEGGHTLPVRLDIPFELVVRESCAAPNGQ